MSALPQRIAPSRPKAQLVMRPRGIHHGLSRVEVVKKFSGSAWAGRALSLHLHRVTSGCAQAAWIQFVYAHTIGSSDVNERRLEWSKPLLPEDAAKENGLSVQINRQARNQCVALGFTPRRSSDKLDGNDFYRFQVDFERMATAPNARTVSNFPDQDASIPRKPAKSERAENAPESAWREEKANLADSETTYAESRARVVAPVSAPPQPLPAKTPTVVVRFEEHQIEIINDLPCKVNYTTSTVAHGKHRIVLTSPGSMGEPPAGTRVQPEPSALAGAGRVKESIDLAERLAALGIACEDRDLAIVRRDLRCDPEYFLASVTERVANSKSGKKIGNRLLPNLVESANEKWRNGGKKAWEESRAVLARDRQLRCACGGEIMDAQTGLCWKCAGGSDLERKARKVDRDVEERKKWR